MAKTKHLCPVCGKIAGCGTFLCVGCMPNDPKPNRWAHNKCGNYTSSEVQMAKMKGEENQLRCNKCKEVCPLLLWTFVCIGEIKNNNLS